MKVMIMDVGSSLPKLEIIFPNYLVPVQAEDVLCQIVLGECWGGIIHTQISEKYSAAMF